MKTSHAVMPRMASPVSDVASLARACTIAGGSAPYDERVRGLLDEAVRTTGARCACAWTLDERARVYRVLAHIGLQSTDRWSIALGSDASPFSTAAIGSSDAARSEGIRSVAVAPIARDDSVVGALALFDLPRERESPAGTEYLRALAALTAAILTARRRRADYLDTLNHELRTPLTSIKGATALLVEKLRDAGAETAELLEMVGNNAERLLRLINDMLDVTKAECRMAAIRKRACDPTRLIERAVAGMMGYAEHNDVSLRTDIAPELRAIVADPDRVEQILTNLLSNAVKFSHHGGEVVVRARTDGAMLRVDIIDHGVGISPSDLPLLFTQYSQLDPRRETLPGTGLGLVITQGLIEAHGGTIGVSSRAGAGSTFTFTLPFAKRADD